VGGQMMDHIVSVEQTPHAVGVIPAPTEGIEILLDLAKKGTIDPWNVDIARVTDEYLAYVESLSEQAVADARESQKDNPQLRIEGVIDAKEQAHMRLTGKTILYLAILLRMKSDLLAGFDPFEQDYLEDADFGDLQEFDEYGNTINPQALGQDVADRLQAAVMARYGTLKDVLQRRNSAKQKRIRQVTLQDLITELKKYDALEKERSARSKVERSERRRGMRDYTNFSTEDITQLAHDEFQEETVQWVHEVLGTYLEKENPDAVLSLSDLSDLAETDTISTFLSLLFLEARYEVVMEQPDFYSDEIFVRWYTQADETAHATAMAE